MICAEVLLERMEVLMLETFTAPLPSRATRAAPKRSRASNRSTLVASLPAHARPIKITAHSGLERGLALWLLAQPDTYDLIDQPPCITFRTAEGKISTHTYDFLHVAKDGRSTAYIVKPYLKTQKLGFLETCAAIRRATPFHFAQEVVLFTERDLPKEHIWNAARCLDARKYPDESLDSRVLGVLRDVATAVSIAEVVQNCGTGNAYRAVVRLIFSGKVRCLDAGRILVSSRIEINGGDV